MDKHDRAILGQGEIRKHISRRAFFGIAAAAAAAPSFLAHGRAAAATRNESTDRGQLGLTPDEAADRIVASVRRPVFRNQAFPITSFGGVGDGTTDNTAAFRAAIGAANASGGGQVLVPAGTFLTGAIHLLSNVELHVTRDATVLFSTDPNAYLPVVYTSDGGIELMNYSPFIYAFGQHDIAITGEGTLDGQASNQAWWPWAGKTQFGWSPGDSDGSADSALAEQMATDGVPVDQRVFGAGHYLRPQFIQPYRCQNVLISGITIHRTPNWQMNPVLCTNVTIENTTNTSLGPNNDGCDPESCDGVVIQNVTFNTGDDCIAIKAGKDADGRRVNTPCQNVVIQNCHFASGHGGITIGSEMTGGVRNVYARDLVMDSPSLQAGHRLKTNSVRGGFIENTNVFRVQAGTIGGPLLKVEGDYGNQTGDFLPTVTDINLAGWTVDECQGVWSIMGTSATDPVGTVTLSDISVTTSTAANSAQNISDLIVNDVTVGGVEQTG